MKEMTKVMLTGTHWFNRIVYQVGHGRSWQYKTAGFYRRAFKPTFSLTHPYAQSIISIITGVVAAENIVVSNILVAAGPVSALNCCDIR